MIDGIWVPSMAHVRFGSKNSHSAVQRLCPLYPQKRTSLSALECPLWAISGFVKLAKTIDANFAWATEKLMSVASAELDMRKIKASDKIRAIEVLAKLHGWNAPEKTNISGELKPRVRLNVTYTREPLPQEKQRSLEALKVAAERRTPA